MQPFIRLLFFLLLRLSGPDRLCLHSIAQAAGSWDKEMCCKYAPLYANIERDLMPWRDSGISLDLIKKTIKAHTSYPRAAHSQKGFAAGFRNGTAVLLTPPLLTSWTGHHAAIWIVYMKMLVKLQERFGDSIPDVDFVVSSVDRPLQLASTDRVLAAEDEPVFRFCKTDKYADVLIPDFHFYEDKKDVVFGRFSPYDRHLHSNDTTALRQGFGGEQICTGAGRTVMCPVRRYFAEWSRQHASFDVSVTGSMEMAEHAQFKYLVHLDGQGLSSRLEQLLPLGSLVFKEESGYRGFYHQLLRPFEHYVPFWRERPEDILDGLAWARHDEQRAMQVALRGQSFAVRFFNVEALSCYWLTLLTSFAKLLRYNPAEVESYGNRRVGRTEWMPVQEYIDTVAREFQGGAMFNAFDFSG